MLLAIGAGRGAVGLSKERIEVRKVVEAALEGDIGNGAVRHAKLACGVLHAHTVHEIGRRHAQKRTDAAGDVLC